MTRNNEERADTPCWRQRVSNRRPIERLSPCLDSLELANHDKEYLDTLGCNSRLHFYLDKFLHRVASALLCLGLAVAHSGKLRMNGYDKLIRTWLGKQLSHCQICESVRSEDDVVRAHGPRAMCDSGGLFKILVLI